MDLYEYQAKKLFLKFGLPVLNNWVISKITEIKGGIENVINGPPWIVKCQINAGGRGKSGGVQIVYTEKEILSYAKKWLGRSLITSQTTESGEIVDSILIESLVNISQELYLSMLLDRDNAEIVLIVSKKGGVNIEDLISKYPDLLYKIPINPNINSVYEYDGRIIARKLGLIGNQIHQFVDIYKKVISMFIKNDLLLVEINPLVITNDNNLICLDAKVTIDHNALFRQSELLKLCVKCDNMENSSVLYSSSMNYVSLSGNIGCMVNGAGLAMATMDLMQSLGGSPANFLDIGGGTNENHIISALKIFLQTKKINAVFINIFGGIVCCDLVANSIIKAVSECIEKKPVVVRLEGNNAELGSNKLRNSGFNIVVMSNLLNALKKVITLVN